MKIATKIIIVFLIINSLLILSGGNCSAQQIKQSSSQALVNKKRTINRNPFIFEGIVIQQKCYAAKNGGILTCNVIQITKIFNGSPKIKLGSIKVITTGGHLENDTSPLIEPSDSWAGFYPGLTYIVFGSVADSALLTNNMIDTDNILSLQQHDLISITDVKNKTLNSKDVPAANWHSKTFKTLDNLYIYLKDNYDLTIQEEASSKQSITPADNIKQKKQK